MFHLLIEQKRIASWKLLKYTYMYMKVQIGLSSKTLGEAILVPSQAHLHVCNTSAKGRAT